MKNIKKLNNTQSSFVGLFFSFVLIIALVIGVYGVKTINGLKTENVSLTNSVSTLTADNNSLLTQKTTLQIQLTTKTTEYNAKVVELNNANSNISTLNSQITTLTSDNTSLQNSISLKDSTITSLNATISQLQAQLNALQNPVQTSGVIEGYYKISLTTDGSTMDLYIHLTSDSLVLKCEGCEDGFEIEEFIDDENSNIIHCSSACTLIPDYTNSTYTIDFTLQESGTTGSVQVITADDYNNALSSI